MQERKEREREKWKPVVNLAIFLFFLGLLMSIHFGCQMLGPIYALPFLSGSAYSEGYSEHWGIPK
jgi:hypothetical protein